VPASRPRVPALAVVFTLVVALACGPEGDDIASATESTTTTTTATTTAATDGQTSTSAGDSETGGGDTDGSVVEVDGVTLSDAGHHYECIDGCEGFYSSHSYILRLTADVARDVEVAWWGWSIDGVSTIAGDAPYEVENVHLEPGVSTRIDLRFDYTDFCSFEEWSLPLVIYVEVDGSWREVAGTSTAGYGWDC
jgi:hypothetical protein